MMVLPQIYGITEPTCGRCLFGCMFAEAVCGKANDFHYLQQETSCNACMVLFRLLPFAIAPLIASAVQQDAAAEPLL